MNGKEKQRIQEQIDRLEKELLNALTKKDSRTKEIDLPKHQARINKLRKQLNENN